jgi:hypothetical protein
MRQCGAYSHQNRPAGHLSLLAWQHSPIIKPYAFSQNGRFISFALRIAGESAHALTFRIRSILWNNSRIRSTSLLPVIFPERLGAVTHILGLQKPFPKKGYDRSQDEWWARHAEKQEICRWSIEEDDEESLTR